MMPFHVPPFSYGVMFLYARNNRGLHATLHASSLAVFLGSLLSCFILFKGQRLSFHRHTPTDVVARSTVSDGTILTVALTTVQFLMMRILCLVDKESLSWKPRELPLTQIMWTKQVVQLLPIVLSRRNM